MAWSKAARDAAIASRRAKAKGQSQSSANKAAAVAAYRGAPHLLQDPASQAAYAAAGREKAAITAKERKIKAQKAKLDAMPGVRTPLKSVKAQKAAMTRYKKAQSKLWGM